MEIQAVGRGSSVWGSWDRQDAARTARADGQPRAQHRGQADQAADRILPVEEKGRAEKDGAIPGRVEDAGCRTCENRKYQDGSDDPSVSFQSPTNIAPDAVASAVRGHEQEHVSHEQAKAQMEGRRVVSQTVTLHTGICPECGRVYISGGTTRTVTKGRQDPGELAKRFQVGNAGPGAGEALSSRV